MEPLACITAELPVKPDKTGSLTKRAAQRQCMSVEDKWKSGAL